MSNPPARFRASRSTALLAELRERLSHETSQRAQLEQLGELLAASIVDYCVVDQIDHGELVRVGAFHADWDRRDLLLVASAATPRRAAPAALSAPRAFAARAPLLKQIHLAGVREPVRSAGVLPVRAFGQPIAVLTVLVCKGTLLSATDLAFLDEVGAWATVLLESTALRSAQEAQEREGRRSFPPWPAVVAREMKRAQGKKPPRS